MGWSFARAAAISGVALVLACGSLLDVGAADEGAPDAGTSGEPDASLGTTCGLAVEPSALDFGDVFAGGSATQTITIKNLGSAAANVEAVTTDSAFALSSGSVVIEPSAEAPIGVTFAPGAAGLPIDARLSLKTADCQLADISLGGTGVPASGFAIQPGSVTLTGKCSQLPGTAQLTITSGTAQETTFAITGAVAPFIVNASPSAQTALPGKGSVPVAISSPVVLPAMPGTIGPAKLTVKIDAEQQARAIDVFATARGAALSFSKATLAVSSKYPTKNVMITNAGNASVSVTFKTTGQGFSVNPPAIFLGPSTASTFVVSAMGSGAAAGVVTVSVDAPVCGALPVLAVTSQ